MAFLSSAKVMIAITYVYTLAVVYAPPWHTPAFVEMVVNAK